MVTISSNGKYLVNSITGQPVFLTGDAPQIIFEQISNADLETYLAQHQLPNEWDYFDPAKADEKRECGLHASWGGKAVAGNAVATTAEIGVRSS